MTGQINEETGDHFQVENSKEVHHIYDTDTGNWERTLTEKGK